MIKNCIECGKEFKPRKERIETAKWCGNDCALIGRSKLFKGNKLRCGLVPKNAYKKGENEKENHPRWKERNKFTCINCSNEFEKEKWRSESKTHTNQYCSVFCRSEYKKNNLSGENAKDFVGGQQTYRGKNFNKIRLEVIDMQNGHCIYCNAQIGKSLHVHHIKPFRYFDSPEKANCLSNLIGLCNHCHMKVEHQTRINCIDPFLLERFRNLRKIV